ncbi:histone-lysine N-methyltransferase, H3 lysine-9 specific SUVH1-like [Primulina huaijiensis]|uniref:histone-lysine N-methyltransferase, H3 lysine-9 specific SUVH1-like n=1 Tax=Primulina huaijiensis TaxID=1492673 RepID=UPI003CC78B57
MDQDLGSESNPHSGSADKSKILRVKPLRCLVPVFPNPPGMSSVTTPQPSPFVCVPPSGPFPSGVQPFYPFLVSNNSQQATFGASSQPGNLGFGSNVQAPIPLNSFRTPTPKVNGDAAPGKRGFSGFPKAEDVNSGKGKSHSRKRRAGKGEDFGVGSLVDSLLTSFKLKEFDEFRRSNGDRDTVETILLAFDLLRRKLTQLEESKDLVLGVTKRPDLKASNLLMSHGVRTNNTKRIGHVPGVEVGDIFLFRMELCIVGLHAPSMAGIDYMGVKVTVDEEPVAVSIVSSGGYDDQGDDPDVLIYSGHGGVQRRDGQMFDQKLEKGNLALEKSLHRANDVRVLRGVKDAAGSTGKMYVYDGLYKIQESWAEKNQSGCNVFKYKLVRVPGQPEAYSLWKSIQQWKEGTVARAGVIISDLASGAEGQPVTLVNDVDGEKGPAHFTYTSSLRYLRPFSTSKPSMGCHCKGGCQPGDIDCPCIQKNGGVLPYTSSGVLLSDKSLIHECAQSCTCPPTCRNRISQAGLKTRLEVFKTKTRGWGLRSWDPIRAGCFICEYAGDVIQAPSSSDFDDNHIFYATSYYEPFEAISDDSTSSTPSPFPLVISAKNSGNVARFMNHSCSPNVFWKPVLQESNNDTFLHIAFFAIRHIPPMQELTYKYGMVTPEKGDQERKRCLCGSVKCKGFFY